VPVRSLFRRLFLAATCVALYAVAAASYRVNPPGTFSLIGGLLVLAFGVFVLSRGPHIPLNRAFFYLSMAFTMFVLLVYLLHLAVAVGLHHVETPVWLLRNGLLLAPAAMTYFTYRFVGGEKRYLRVLSWVALLNMLPFIALNFLGKYVSEYRRLGWTYVPDGELTYYRISSVCTMLWAFVSAVVVIGQCFRPEQRARRGQFLLFLVGWGVAVGHAFVGYLPAFNRLWFPTLTGVTWAVFPLVLGVAVIRVELFDIKVVIRRTLPYAIGTALIGALYAACLAGLEALGAHLDILPQGTRWIVLLILVGLAFQPLLEGLQSGLDRMFFRAEAEMDRFLAQAGLRYRMLDSRLGLARTVAADAIGTLKLEGAAVLLGENAISVVSAGEGETWLRRTEGLALPSAISSREIVEHGAEERLDLRGADALAERLTQADVHLVVPFGEGASRGLLACRRKRSHFAFTPRDRMFLLALAAQAETALSRIEAQQDADAAHRLTEAVFESMTNAVALVDAGERVLSCNPAFARAFGASTGSPLAEMGLSGSTAKEALTGPREIHAAEGVFLVSAKALDATKGTTLLVLTDVTELRRLQEADARRAALAEIGATVSAINHEIGNIISPVGFFLRKAQQASDPDEAQEAFENATQRIRMLEGLSRELRGYYKEPHLALRRVSLAQAVESALADVSAAAGAGWVAPALDGLDLALQADPQKLKQVLLNILKNAWEAMREGKRRDWSVRAESEGDRARIEIRDAGPGIPAEQLARLFEPFFTTKEDGGTGLGLAIVRRLVQAHGAEIAAESAPGEGTTFTLLWPVAT